MPKEPLVTAETNIGKPMRKPKEAKKPDLNEVREYAVNLSFADRIDLIKAVKESLATEVSKRKSDISDAEKMLEEL